MLSMRFYLLILIFTISISCPLASKAQQNSSSSSREYMKEYWPRLESSGLNTVLAAIEWSLIEPLEGKFGNGNELVQRAKLYRFQ
jgi:hypothetical protein